MNFWHNGFIWFSTGIILVVVLAAIRAWRRDAGAPLRWWHWVLILAWLLFFGVSCAFIGTSLGEGEITAATRGGIIMGLLVLISGVAIWRLLPQAEAPRQKAETDSVKTRETGPAKRPLP